MAFRKNYLVISSSLKKSRGKCTRPWSCPLCSIASKLCPCEKICFSDFGASTTFCPQYVSHKHRPHYPPQHHFRKPLSPFGNLECRQVLSQPSPPLSWPRRTHAHGPGAAAATHRLSDASFVLPIPLKNHIFVICGAHLARSIIENISCEGLDRVFRKLLACGLKEGIKAV